MADARVDSTIRQGSKKLKRRGLIAAAAALAAGIAAKQTAEPVAAATVTLGTFNTEAATTTFYLPGPSTTAALLGTADTGIGVQGTAYNVYAVYGNVPSASGASNTIGVYGSNQATGTNNNGVTGQSATGYGVVGYTSGGSASMSGISDHTNIPAFAGGNSAPGGLAASFAGTVYVNGPFVVADPANKHGAIKGSDGKHRLVYSMEAPEPWLEDFGTGTLANGKAEVKLEARFADVIRTDDYHVFITPHDGDHSLAVPTRGGQSFSVEANPTVSAAAKGKKAADLGGTFSWRVVARPRSEGKGERLPEFMVPDIKLPRVEDLPAPTPPPDKKP